MLKNFLFLNLKSIRYRPVRSWLTIIGIVIGIMLVVVILALGNGIQNTVKSTLQMFGSNLIVVMPGKETNPLTSFFGGERFREKDLVALEKIPGVKFVALEDIATMNIEFDGEKKSTLIHSVQWTWMRELLEESEGIKLEQGYWPQDLNASEVILGNKIASSLFKNPVKVGEDIIIKGKRMKVAGILSPIGEQMSDNIIFMPQSIFQSLTGKRSVAMSADVKVLPGADINLIAKQVKFELSKQDVVRDFSVLTPEKTERIAGNVLSIIELVLVFIALISLIVGAVGIMNTMYTSVLERTKQIGIMKAIGATNDDVLSLFLLESGIIGLVGGILGIILGIGVAYLIGLYGNSAGIKGLFSFASLDYFGLFVILFLTFVIGVVSGLMPAKRASKMEPADALRYE
ncbi:MAG TPA: ABC transporter permease [Candidatus Paceibacterota bacterium]|nr:ABC transporter permease [Candidatus Paceibacterota bacterium]